MHYLHPSSKLRNNNVTSMFIQVIGAIFVIKTCIRVRVHEFINLADAVLPSKVELLSF